MHDMIVPMGPYHPGLHEPEYFKLYLKGEEIENVEIYLGYNHRGVEKLVEGKNWYSALFNVERICGICSIVHSSAYLQAVETLQELDVPMRAQFIRTILLEVERLQSHLLWLGIASHQIGFETLFMHCWTAREKVLDVVEEIAGNRIHYSINTIGGVRRDITKNQADKVRTTLKSLKAEVDELAGVCLHDPFISQRLRGVGVLPEKDAQELGAVGPTARGSGLTLDARSSGFWAYSSLGFKPVCRKGGDCWSRMEVRLDELTQSIGMMEMLLDGMPGGQINLGRKFIKILPGHCLGRVEAPRGEVIHYVVSNGDVNPWRDRIRTPSYANFNCLKKMLIGEELADAASIITSIDPCMSCTDRALVVDEKGKKEIVDLGGVVHAHHH